MSLMRLVYHTTRKNKQYVVDASCKIKNEGCYCSPHFYYMIHPKCFSSPIVVSGPWPQWHTVSSGSS